MEIKPAKELLRLSKELVTNFEERWKLLNLQTDYDRMLSYLERLKDPNIWNNSTEAQKITKLKKENSEMQEKLKNIQNTKFLSETLQNEIRSKRLELEEILDSKQQYTKTINTMPIKHVDTYILELEMQKKTIIELEDELKAGLKHLEVHGTRKDCKCCGLL